MKWCADSQVANKKTDNALKLAAKIKHEMHKQYPYIKCSIGIAPNTFLSKVASNMQKPDGCIVIEQHEVPEKLYRLKLRDLNGVGRQMEARLNRYRIATVKDLYAANKDQLRRHGAASKANACMTSYEA